MSEQPTSAPKIIPPSSVAKNSLLLFGFQVFTRILGFFSAILLANYFGVESFGEYNYAFALTALFVPLCDLGMDIYVLREIPRITTAEASRLASSVLQTKLLITVGVFLCVGITAGAMEHFGSKVFIIIILAGIVTPLRTYWTTFSSVLRAINKVHVEAVIYSATRLSEFLVITATILFHRDLIELLLILSFVNAAASIYTYYTIHQRYLPLTSSDKIAPRLVLMGGLPFALTGILVSIYFNFDTVLVSKIINDKAAGIYRAAYNLIIPITMITVSVSGAIFPYISQNYKTQPEQVNKTVERSLTYLLLIALPIAVITTLLSRNIVGFLFKPEYATSAVSLLILVWFLPIAFLTNIFGNVLGAMDMQSYVLRVAGINVAVNIITNILLIPVYAQNGAAFVTVLTEFVGFVFLYSKMRTIFPRLFDKTQLIKGLLSCIPVMLFLIVCPHWHVLILLAASVIIYGVALLSIKAISVEEISQIATMIKSRK